MGCGSSRQTAPASSRSPAVLGSETVAKTSVDSTSPSTAGKAPVSAILSVKADPIGTNAPSSANLLSSQTVQRPEELVPVFQKAENQVVVVVPAERYGAVSGALADCGCIDSVVLMGGLGKVPCQMRKPAGVKRFFESAARQLFYCAPTDRETVTKLAGADVFFALKEKRTGSGTVNLSEIEAAAKKEGELAAKDVLAAVSYLKSRAALGPKEIVASYTMPGMNEMLNLFLRGGSGAFAEYAAQLKQGMCDLCPAVTETRTAVYRGAKLDPALLSDLDGKKGQCLLLSGFVSATLSKDLAAMGDEQESMLIEIRLIDYDDSFEDGLRAFGLAVEDAVFFPVNVEQHSVSPREHEVVFPPFYPTKIAGVGTELIGGRLYQKLELRAPKCVHVTGRARLDNPKEEYTSNWKKQYVETMLLLCERRIVTRLSLVDMDFMKEEATFARVLELVKEGNCAELLVEQAAVADTQIARIIRECKRSLGTLMRLSLNNAELGVFGISLIAQMLAGNGVLEVLELAGNDTRPFGAKAIMGALLKNNALTELNMTNTHIESGDVESIEAALMANKTLAMLDISSNKLGMPHMQDIVKALEKNEALLSLNMSCNQFNGRSTVFEESLAKNSTLVFLSLDAQEYYMSSKLNEMMSLNSLLLFQQYKSDPSKYSEKRRRAIEEVLDNDMDRTRLDLKGIEGKNVDKIAAILGLNSTVTAVRIAETERVFRAFSGLAGNRVLTRLDIRACKLESEEQLLLTGILTSDTTLTYVNISQCNLDGTTVYFIMLSLQVNRTLKKLKLKGNRTTEAKDMKGVLGETFTVNNTLELIDLSENDIGDDQMVPMIKALRKNTALLALRIDNCSLGNDSFTALAETLKVNKTLKKLYVSGNNADSAKFHELCQALADSTTLTHLRYDADLCGEDAKALAVALKANKTLIGLHFVRGDTSELFRQIAEEKGATNIKAMKFIHLTMIEESGKEIAKLLSTVAGLERLDFASCIIANETFPPVTKVLAENTTITMLNMKACQMDMEIVGDLMPEVLIQNSTISCMNFRWCHITSGRMVGFFEALKYNKGLKTLYLDENPAICELSRDRLLKAIVLNKTLSTLYVGIVLNPQSESLIKYIGNQYKVLQKFITPDGVNRAGKQRGMSEERWWRHRRNLAAAQIQEILKDSHSRMLCLNDFYMDIDSMKTLGETLKTNAHIKLLEISFCNGGLGDAFVKALSEMLLVNQVIEAFRLIGDGISQEGVRCIAKVIRGNKRIVELMVLFEDVGNAGAREIADAFKVNTALNYLTLVSCNIGDEGMIALVEAFQANKHFSKVTLENNLIGDLGAKKLLEALRAGPKRDYTICIGNNRIGAELLEQLGDCQEIKLK